MSVCRPDKSSLLIQVDTTNLFHFMKIFQQAKIMGTYIKQKVEHFLIFRNDKIQRSLAGAGTGEGGGGSDEESGCT